jgi:hypothetical protein
VSQQSQPLLFTDEAIAESIGPVSRLLLKLGVVFFDYDLDGRLDLLTANGHLEQEIAKIQKSQTYAEPAQLFWKADERSGGRFVVVSSDKCGPDLLKPIHGRGLTGADRCFLKKPVRISAQSSLSLDERNLSTRAWHFFQPDCALRIEAKQRRGDVRRT